MRSCSSRVRAKSPAFIACHASQISSGMQPAKPISAPSTPTYIDDSSDSSWQVKSDRSGAWRRNRRQSRSYSAMWRVPVLRAFTLGMRAISMTVSAG